MRRHRSTTARSLLLLAATGALITSCRGGTPEPTSGRTLALSEPPPLGGNLTAAVGQAVRAADPLTPPIGVAYYGPYVQPCSQYSDSWDEQMCWSIPDGCIPAGKKGRALSFTLFTYNDGLGMTKAPDQPPNPPPGSTPDTFANNNPIWVWSWSHGHYHLRDYGVYRLIDAHTKRDIKTGQKFTFLITEIGAGGSDGYVAGIPCQFVLLGTQSPGPGGSWIQDPNPVPDGEYNLLAQVNVAGSIPEERVFDNSSLVRFTLTGDALTALPPTWNDIELVAQQTGATQPAAIVSRAANSYDLFYVGPDGKLYTGMQRGTTQGWSSGSGIGAMIYDPTRPNYVLTGRPAAVGRGPQFIDVVARNTDSQVMFFRGTAATDGTLDWTYYPGLGVAASPPAIAAGDFRRMMAGWVTPTGTFQYQYNGGFAWKPVADLGGTFATDQPPTLVASSKGIIHLFLRTPSGAVRYNRHIVAADGSLGWVGWKDLGGSVTALSAASPYLNQVVVFATGTDGKLLKAVWDAQSDTFSAWQNDGGIGQLVSPPTVVSTGSNALDVFYFQSSVFSPTRPPFFRRHYQGGAVTVSEQVGSLFGVSGSVPLVVGSWADRSLDLVLQLDDGSIVAKPLR